MARGGSSSGARRLAQSVRHGLEAEIPPEMAGYAQGGMASAEAETVGSFMLEQLVQWDGNLAELFQDSETGKRKLAEIGSTVLREFKLDDSARADWKESAENALSSAGQKKGEKKTYPFDGAANVKYPLLTSAAIQFAARAYPNIVRGDEVVAVKINGDDTDSAKSERSERVSAFCNDQIIYQCPEWETGTDALLHQLPITGAGFRKIYWDTSLKRPRFDYAPALKVVIPIDAPSLELAPRVTHILDAIYPHDYESRIASGTWLKCEIQSNTEDTQKPIQFLEQCRYIDMDEDGLSEPYIVVVHKDSGAVVRIDPAFDVEDIKRNPPNEDGSPGKIYCINRLLPWVDYCFLPDPEGGAYGIGFGKLLEAISETINTLLNQMIDAGHWQNTNTGFIGAGFKTRGGTISLEPNVFKMLDGVQNVREAMQRLEFPGPSNVSFQLVEMLLGAAQDITAIKDVLAGDMPGGQHVAEGTVMALIEQGLQVFTSIYKRIYRSMRKEFELQCRLNQRYLAPEDYQKFLDTRPKPQPAQNAPQGAPPMDPRLQIGGNNGPPMGPEDMGGPMPAMPPGGAPPMMGGEGAMPMDGAMGAPAPQGGPPMPQPGQGAVVPFPGPMQAQPAPTPETDFDLSDLDIRPVADPTAITDMQRMAKAQFKMSFINDPAINRIEVIKSVWRDARIANPEQYIVEQNPAAAKAQELDFADKEAGVNQKNADADLKKAQAAEIMGQAPPKPEVSDPFKQRELDLRERELSERRAMEDYQADIAAADREVQMLMEEANRARDDEHRRELTALEREKIAVAQSKADAVRSKSESKASAPAKDAQSEIAQIATSIQQMSLQSQEKITDAIGKMLTGVSDSNSQIAAGLKAMAASIEQSNKIALAPTELVKGADGKPAGSVKKL